PQAIDRTVPFGEAFLGRSWMRSTLANYGGAIEDAESAADWFQSPERNAEALASIAWTERLQGHIEAAESNYEQALRRAGDNAYLAFLYATLLFDLDRDAEALPELQKSIELGDSYGYPSFWFYLHNTDRVEAKHALDRYLEDAKDWPEPIGRYYLGTISA